MRPGMEEASSQRGKSWEAGGTDYEGLERRRAQTVSVSQQTALPQSHLPLPPAPSSSKPWQ